MDLCESLIISWPAPPANSVVLVSHSKSSVSRLHLLLGSSFPLDPESFLQSSLCFLLPLSSLMEPQSPLDAILVLQTLRGTCLILFSQCEHEADMPSAVLASRHFVCNI